MRSGLGEAPYAQHDSTFPILTDFHTKNFAGRDLHTLWKLSIEMLLKHNEHFCRETKFCLVQTWKFGDFSRGLTWHNFHPSKLWFSLEIYKANFAISDLNKNLYFGAPRVCYEVYSQISQEKAKNWTFVRFKSRSDTYLSKQI